MAKVKRLGFKLPSAGLFIAVLLAGVFVLLPLGSASEYSFRTPILGPGTYGWDNYAWFVSQPDFGTYISLSLLLAAVAAAITLLVLVPTVVWLNLRGQRLRPLMEFLTLLPLVIPVVALAIGAQTSLPVELQSNQYSLSFFYFVLALPYTYRTLDIGIRAIPLKTLSEAARSLGASQFKVIALVLAPVVRGAVIAAVFLTIALSLGEFTLTSLLHWQTFTTWVTVISQSNILGAIALSVFTIVAAFALLLVVGLVSIRTKRRQVSEES